MTIKVSVVGASGRMGKLALELIDAAQDLSLHSTLDSKSNLVETNGADVIFDVTRLDVSRKVVQHALATSTPIVVGTSGWLESEVAAVESKMKIGDTVVIIPNFSVGSMLATWFAAEAAKHFSTIEIVEAHHERKVDSPSGTAIRTAELISKSRGERPLVTGSEQQARGQIVEGIPIHSLRLQGLSAKQEVYLGAESEILKISHETTSVYAYAAGILASIRFAAKNPGLFVGLEAVL